ncbi:MAG TPA: thiamine phosphate synthase [Thermoanaerobaculia bacterium]|jgi:thiamine-phosphate pyrophosphorylase
MRSLYVTDRRAIGDAAFEGVLDSLHGEAGLAVELREKGTPDGETLAWAELARKELGVEVPLFVNRRLDLALAAKADGVHLPADGLPLRRVRAASPRGLKVGVSTHSVEEAVRAIGEGADLVVFGPIYETPSKRPFGPPLGPGVLEDLPPLATHGAQVFAIGGIDESRLEEIAQFRDRVSGIAAIRLFQEAADPRAVVERIGRL